jgi:hypothetical protein
MQDEVCILKGPTAAATAGGGGCLLQRGSISSRQCASAVTLCRMFDYC